MELANAVGFQAGDAQHLQHAFRGLLAHGLQSGMLACVVNLRDDGLQGIADPRNLLEPSFGYELCERQRAETQIVSGLGIGTCPVWVAALQLHALGEFPQDLRDGGGIGSGHGSKRAILRNGPNRAAAPRVPAACVLTRKMAGSATDDASFFFALR